MQVQVEEALIGKEEAWLKRAERIFKDERFTIQSTRSLSSSAGNFQCLEAASGVRYGIVNSVCFASESGVVAGFDGVASDLHDFYRIVTSARTVRRK
jgi:hypothetical protein